MRVLASRVSASTSCARASAICASVLRASVCARSKSAVDATPLVWTHDGAALNLLEEAQEPFNAGALKRRREEKAMESIEDAMQWSRAQETAAGERETDLGNDRALGKWIVRLQP